MGHTSLCSFLRRRLAAGRGKVLRLRPPPPFVVEQANEISVAKRVLIEQKLVSNLNRSCCKDNCQDRLKEVNAQ